MHFARHLEKEFISTMSKKILTKVKIVLLIFFVIFVLIALIIKTLDLFMNKYSDKVFSPDGTYYTQVSETNGGATTGFISGVTLINAKSIWSDSVRLSGWSGNGYTIFAFNGSGDSINAVWLNSRTLEINYTDCTKIYRQDKSWKHITVLYSGKCLNSN
jgi:hypothetical protein